MPMILSDGKKKWVAKKRPKILKGSALNPSAASEARYYQALRTLIMNMSRHVEQKLKDFYTTAPAIDYFAEDSTTSAQAQIVMKILMQKFQAIFDLAATPLATNVTADASKSSAGALQTSLQKLSGGLTLKTDILTGELKDILTATIAENVSLIKSISSEYLTQVESAVYRSITTGNGLQDLVPFLHKQQGVTLNRARIIARDQTRKAFSNLNFARMEKIGIQEYEWLHSAGGQKPRKLHQRMSGNIYRFDTPPVIDEKTGQRGKPGDLINCRCRAVPVIKFDEK
jgi:SPP1 gp7 family putative phage head morphogenesis protein